MKNEKLALCYFILLIALSGLLVVMINKNNTQFILGGVMIITSSIVILKLQSN